MYDKLSYLINVKMKLLSLLISKIEVKIANTSQNRKRKYIQRRGGQIGAETILLSGADCFGSEPYLVNIGDKCLISSNVSFITHDGAVSVLNNLNLFEDRIDKMRAIKVGDNTFIGHRVVIMPGVTIGNNCVIKNSIILNDVYIGDNTHIENCIVESHDTIRANSYYKGEDGIQIVVEKSERYVL